MRIAVAAMLAGMAACSLLAQAPGTTLKRRLGVDLAGPNLLKPDAWRAWEKGFELAAAS